MGKLYKQLEGYGNSDFYPYHMPGHKRRICGDIPPEIFNIDITEIDGFDNLHQPEGILKELQEEASKIYGADESFYMVNGSTGGILSAISAVLPVGGHLLMARNSHKSAYHAAYLRTLTISYIYPPMLQDYDVYDAITPKQVADELKQNPDIGAVFLVSPTYEGRIAQVREIAEIVHKRGIPLIVDEAHGAHLGLVPWMSENSCQAGADIVIHSVHKTLPAMTQTALLHVQGNLVDRERLKRFLHIYQTSSPSYVLMASIDNALNALKQNKFRQFEIFREQYGHMLERLKACKNMKFLLPESGRQDIGKLVIFSSKKDLSGRQLYDILLQKYHLQLEMAAGNYCLAMFTVGDTEEAYVRMADALLQIDTDWNRYVDPHCNCTPWSFAQKLLRNETTMQQTTSLIPLAKAWDMEKEILPIELAQGRYIGEFVNLYPPGVPILVPGEIFTKEKSELILSYIAEGLTVQGILEQENSKLEKSKHKICVQVLKA